MTKEHENEWDDYIDPVLFGIRTSVQESTKFTPFFIMHGRQAKFPMEIEKTEAVSDVTKLGDMQNTIDSLISLREHIFPKAHQNITKSQRKQKEQYKQRKGFEASAECVKIGDQVLRLNMVKRTKKGHKSEDTWIGPYEVLDISKYGSCRIQCIATGKEIKQKVNISQLKLYKQDKETSRGK